MKHEFPFDPTYGYDEAKLLTVGAPEGPADFADFWCRTYAEAMAIPLQVERRPIASLNPAFDAWEIEFNSLDNFRIGGWITAPKDGSAHHGLVMGHGYGARDTPHFEPGAITLAACARGFSRSQSPGYPNEAFRHVLHGIKDRETYSHRGSVADIVWNAASALLEVHPELAGRLDYSGESFGGGIGALALPWDNRLRRAHLGVPSFGNHPLRLQMPCVGSGEPVRSHYRRHPEVVEVLAYFDAAIASRHTKIPTLVSPALFDPAVPPPGQFAVYNALAGPKALFIRKAGHFPYPEEAETMQALQSRVTDWWKESGS